MPLDTCTCIYNGSGYRSEGHRFDKLREVWSISEQHYLRTTEDVSEEGEKATKKGMELKIILYIKKYAYNIYIYI